MHRRSRRLIAALLAPWFAVVTVEPAALHQCPMHSAVAAHAGHSMPAAGPLMAMHEHHANSGHDVPSPGRGDAARCTCDSGCCVATAAVAPPCGAELLVAPESLRREPPLLAATGIAAAQTPHVLPFANGPPARV